MMTLKKLTRLPGRALQKTGAKIHYWQNSKRLKTKYRYIPEILYLEVTNRCNANCIFCNRADTHKPLMDMDFELFKKIVDAAPYTTQVHTQGFGEPLLYPYLVDAVKYCKERGKRVVFYTNAYALDDMMAVNLLQVGLDQIRFSVDEISKDPYEHLRRGLKWETVLKNIENFQKRKLDGYGKTETIARICRTKENEMRMDEITKFWAKRVDVVVVNPEFDVIPYDENAKYPFTTISGHIECDNPYTQFAVRSNGDVVLCCVDWFHNYIIDNIAEGDITQERILDIFNNDEYNILRYRMKTGIQCPTRCVSCRGIIAPRRR